MQGTHNKVQFPVLAADWVTS